MPDEEGFVHIVIDGCAGIGGVEACLYGSPNVVIEDLYAEGDGGMLDPGVVAFPTFTDSVAHTVMTAMFHVTDSEPAFMKLADCSSSPQNGMVWVDAMNYERNGFELVAFAGVNADAPPDSLATPSHVRAPDDLASSGLRVWPNPATRTLNLSLPQLAVPAHGRITIHDLTGRRVREIFAGRIAPGLDLTWDTRSDAGEPVMNGLYVVRAIIGERETSHTIIVLRP